MTQFQELLTILIPVILITGLVIYYVISSRKKK